MKRPLLPSIYRLIQRFALFLSLSLLLTAPAWADYHFRAVTQTENTAGQAPGDVTIESWVKGDQAKILFESGGGNPMTPDGTYLLTQDGGRTFVLVNPQEKTYAEWDIEAMLRFAGDMLNGLGGLMSFEVEDPTSELISEEDSDEVLGYPTRHYRFRSTYTLKIKALGIKRSNATTTIQDVWVTDHLDDEGFGAWLRKDPPTTGNKDLDALMRSELNKTEGILLKSVTETRSVNQGKKKKKQKEQVTRTVTEMTKLEETTVKSSLFEIPEGYQKTEMAIPAGGEEDGNPLKGLFKQSAR